MAIWFVSRHPGAIEWAAQQGLRVDRQISHLDPDEVQTGDTVIGTLPVHLAATVCALGARFLNLSLDLRPEWRGRELSADELRQCNARLEHFDIRTPPAPRSQQAASSHIAPQSQPRNPPT